MLEIKFVLRNNCVQLYMIIGIARKFFQIENDKIRLGRT